VMFAALNKRGNLVAQLALENLRTDATKAIMEQAKVKGETVTHPYLIRAGKRTCSMKLQQQTRGLPVRDAATCGCPRRGRRSARPPPPLCKQGVRGSSPLGSTYFPLSNLLSALVGGLNSEHLQQQPAAVGP
jgi:hypothetical protein